MFSSVVADGVELRPLEVWQAPAFAAHLDRAREHIRPWVGPGFVAEGLDAAGAVLQRYADSAAADGGRLYGLWDGEDLLGGVMFVSFDPGWGICEIGCWLEPAGEGRGLVTRATAILLDWAFLSRGLTRAEWRCRSDNDRSIAVAHRLGMQLEGTLRSSWVYGGRRYDKQVFSVLAEEWRTRTTPEGPRGPA